MLGIDIANIIATGFKMGASDIHLIAGRSPIYRINGQLVDKEEGLLNGEVIRLWGEQMIRNPQNNKELYEKGQVDFSTVVPDVGRVRTNLYIQSDSMAIAMRLVPLGIPRLDKLGMPTIVQELLYRQGGLLLVSGAAGNGKSTSLAGMIGQINQFQQRHIITLEDPIEYVHSQIKSIISQREIGSDTPSFALGLRAALRQDPDIIMVGEMRDLETISIVITAAETGHLVLASLHASSAVQTLERIIDAFSPYQQVQVRGQLANALLGIVNQQLIPSIDGADRWLAAEVLINNPATRNLIRENNIHQLDSAIETGGTFGMVSMRKALQILVQHKKISPVEARRRTGPTWM